MRILRAFVCWLVFLPAVLSLSASVLMAAVAARTTDPVDFTHRVGDAGLVAQVLDAGLEQLEDAYTASGVSTADAVSSTAVARRIVDPDWLTAEFEEAASQYSESGSVTVDLRPVLARLDKDPDADLLILAEVVRSLEQNPEEAEIEIGDDIPFSVLRVRYRIEIADFKAELRESIDSDFSWSPGDGDPLARLSGLGETATTAGVIALLLAAVYIALSRQRLRSVVRLAVGSGLVVVASIGLVRFIVLPLAGQAFGLGGSLREVVDSVSMLILGPALWLGVGFLIGGAVAKLVEITMKERGSWRAEIPWVDVVEPLESAGERL